MPIPRQHSCTIQTCIRNGHVRELCKKYSIYYCELGGVVHICETPPNCDTVEINENRDIVCIFSGIVQVSIDRVWEDAHVHKKSNNTDRANLGLNGKKDSNHVCSKGQCEEQIQVIDRKLNLYMCKVGNILHRCDGSQNCPLTEVTKDGTIVCLFSCKDIGGKIEYNVFGKSLTGTTHYEPNEGDDSDLDVDFGAESEGDMEQEIDGEIGDIKKMNTKLNSKLGRIKKGLKRKRSGEGKKKIKNRKCFDTENPDLIRQSNVIIYDLLFNNQLRDKLNIKATKMHLEIARKAVIKYYKACNKQGIMPILLRADALYDNCMMKCKSLKLTTFESDRQKKPISHTLTTPESNIQRKYGYVIIKLWELVMKTQFFRVNQSKFHFRQHVLGCLHLMKDGHKYQRKNGSMLIVFHKDDFLCKHLPYQNSLKELKKDDKGDPAYTKKQITKGRNNIKGGLKSLVTQVNGEKLLIDFIKDIRHHIGVFPSK